MWGSHVIEFVAYGTAINVGEMPSSFDPEVLVMLDDAVGREGSRRNDTFARPPRRRCSVRPRRSSLRGCGYRGCGYGGAAMNMLRQASRPTISMSPRRRSSHVARSMRTLMTRATPSRRGASVSPFAW